MLGDVNTSVLRYFLYESYAIEKRTDDLIDITHIESNDKYSSIDKKTEVLINYELTKMFLCRVKRDPGLCYHVYSTVKDNKELLAKIHSIILQLCGKTIELNYQVDEQNPDKYGYFQYRLHDADSKLDRDERISAIFSLLSEQSQPSSNEHYHLQWDLYTRPLNDNDINDYSYYILSKYISPNDNSLFSETESTKCREFIAQNIHYLDLYWLNGEPTSINNIINIVKIPFPLEREICLAFFKSDDIHSLRKFSEDLMDIICTEWFMPISLEDKLKCLNKTYPFKAEYLGPLLNEIQKTDSIDPEQIEKIAEDAIFYYRRYDLALELYSFLEKNSEKLSCASKVGQAYREICDYEKALEYFNRAKSDAEIKNKQVSCEIKVNIAEMKYRTGRYDLQEYSNELEDIYKETPTNDIQKCLEVFSFTVQSCISVGKKDIASRLACKYLVNLPTVFDPTVFDPTVFDYAINELKKQDLQKYKKSYRNDLYSFQIERAIETSKKLSELNPDDRIWGECVFLLSYKLCTIYAGKTNREDNILLCKNYLLSSSDEYEILLINLFLSIGITEYKQEITEEAITALKSVTESLLKNKEIANTDKIPESFNLTERLSITEIFRHIISNIAVWEKDLIISYLDEIAKIFNDAGISKLSNEPIESVIAKRAYEYNLFSVAEALLDNYFENSNKLLSDKDCTQESAYSVLISIKRKLNKSIEAKKLIEEALSKYPESFQILLLKSEFCLYEAEYQLALDNLNRAKVFLDNKKNLMSDTYDEIDSELCQKYGIPDNKQLKMAFEKIFDLFDNAISNKEINGIIRNITQYIDRNRFEIFIQYSKIAKEIEERIILFKEYINCSKITRSPDAVQYIQTADYLYFIGYKRLELSKHSELDYSPIIGEYSKAIETLLDDIVTQPLRDCLKPDEVKLLRKRLQHIFGDEKKSISMGQWQGFYADLHKIKNKDLKERIHGKYIHILQDENDREKLGDLCDDLAELRNGAAHLTFNTKNDADKKRKEIVEIINSIIAITAKINTE